MAYPAKHFEKDARSRNPLAGLLRSRKFLLAVAGCITTIVMHYFDFPPEVWGAIDTLILAVIAGIAVEDAAEKRGNGIAG